MPLLASSASRPVLGGFKFEIGIVFRSSEKNRADDAISRGEDDDAVFVVVNDDVTERR